MKPFRSIPTGRPVTADGARAKPALLLVGAAESAPLKPFRSIPTGRPVIADGARAKPALLLVGATESAPW